MPYNFVADSFYIKKLCNRLSSSKVRFYPENGRFALLSPLWGLGATYDDHLKLIGKRVLDFLWVLIELFARCYGWKSAISLRRGPVDQKFQVEGVAPTNRSSSQKTRLNDISYGIKIWTDLSAFCHGSRVWQTDRRTDRLDRQNSHRPRLHSMQRGKNLKRKRLGADNWSMSSPNFVGNFDIHSRVAPPRKWAAPNGWIP